VSTTHTGTDITNLVSIGERIVKQPTKIDLYERVDEVIQMSRLYRSAFSIQVIENAMRHLTDARPRSCYSAFDSGDRAAWERMEALRDWHVGGPQCARCGFREGAHSHSGLFCPAPAGVRGSLFLAMRFQEKRCEASVPISSDGRDAVECGRELLPGCDFCKEHME
jgi:hypothetical protein